MSKPKTTNGFILPKISSPPGETKITLPYNGNAVTEKSFSFSFSCFNRTHELFNLGGTTDDGTVGGAWFLDFLDCLKSVSNLTCAELRQSHTHDLHQIDWAKTNTNAPPSNQQCDYWQFRVSKSKGRVIGTIIDNVFYIVYLDAHHNLTDSEGYGKAEYYAVPLSVYEQQEQKIASCEAEIQHLREENKAYEEIFNEKTANASQL